MQVKQQEANAVAKSVGPEKDPAKKQEYVDTANKYLQQALDLRKKALARTPTPEPLK